MSKIERQSNNFLNEKNSWINDFVTPRFARSLTDEYAHDVLEAIGEDYHNSLDSAIADLKDRIGLTASEAGEIKRVATAMVQKSQMTTLNTTAPVAAAPTPGANPAPGTAPAMKKDQLKGLGFPEAKDPASPIIDEKMPCGEITIKFPGLESKIPGNSPQAQSPLEKFSPLASSNAKTKKAGKLPKGLQDYLDKKRGKKPTEDKKEEPKEEKKDDKKEEVASVAINKKELFSLAKRDRKAFEQKVAELKENKEAMEYVKKLEAWFQGSKDVPKEDKVGVVSNDPEALGYKGAGKGEIMYDHKPMETTAPGGQDSRPFEQKKFEGEAKETKKVMGPSGSELELKKKMQRAQRIEKLKSFSSK